MADDFINRSTYSEKLETAMDSADGSSIVGGLVLAQALLHATPSADAAPVVHAAWTSKSTASVVTWGTCGNCGKIKPVDDYCGGCGAKMDLEAAL